MPDADRPAPLSPEEAQKALVAAIERRTWAAAAGPIVPGGAEVNEAICAFRDAIVAAERAARAGDGLRRAAENLTDRRTLVDDGFWVSQKEMRALDEALGRDYEYTAAPASAPGALRKAAQFVVDDAGSTLDLNERTTVDPALIVALEAALASPAPALDAEPCRYCGSVNGETPTGHYAEADPLDGTTLRRVVGQTCDLNNPRLSEVDWDEVAAALDYALGLDDLRHLAGYDRDAPAPAQEADR